MKKILLSFYLIFSLFIFNGLNVNAKDSVSNGVQPEEVELDTKASLAIQYDTNVSYISDVMLRFGGIINKDTCNQNSKYGVITLLESIGNIPDNYIDNVKWLNEEINGQKIIENTENYAKFNKYSIMDDCKTLAENNYQIAMVIPNVEGHFEQKFVSALFEMTKDNTIKLGTLRTESVLSVAHEYIVNEKLGINENVKGMLEFLNARFDTNEIWKTNDFVGWSSTTGEVTKDQYGRVEASYNNNVAVLEKKVHLKNKNVTIDFQYDNADSKSNCDISLDLVVGENSYSILTHNQKGAGNEIITANLAKIPSLKGVTLDDEDVILKTTCKRNKGTKNAKFRLWHLVLNYEEQTEFVDENPLGGFKKDSQTGFLRKDPNWPRAELKYNKNQSISVSKEFYIPDNNVDLILDLEKFKDAGNVMVFIDIDGTKHKIPINVIKGRNTYNIDLDSLAKKGGILENVNYANKKVKFIIKCDSQVENFVWIWNLAVKANNN